MRFETVKDLLAQAQDLHQGLGRYYQRLSGEAQKEKVRMLLDYLARHEASMADVLGRYGNETAAQVKNMWFGYELDDEVLKCIPPAKPVGDMGIDEIVDLAIRLDDCIIDLYRLVAERAGLPEAREAFASLAALEREAKMRMVRQAMRLDDL